jgi:hypothetical protein
LGLSQCSKLFRSSMQFELSGEHVFHRTSML